MNTKTYKHILVLALGILVFVSGCSDDEDITGQYRVIVNANYAVPTADQATTTGTVPVDENNYKLGEEITLLGNTGNLARTTGATFEGWMVTGSNTVYHEGDVVTIPRTLPSSTYTITVKWPQRVTYNGNSSTGGTAPTDATFYVTGASVTVAPQGTLVRAGYTFNGWNTAANGSGTARPVGSNFAMPLTAVTLFARWTANQNTLTYDGNGNTGGSVPVDNNTYATGSTVNADNNTGNLTRTNFEFLGWNTTASGSGTNVTAGGTFSMPTANTTLYARWAPLYTVTYNGNGNSGGTAPVDSNQYLNGESVTVAAAGTLTRAGFTFNGWNTAADGSGASLPAGSSFVTGFANVTLYAQWQ